MNEIIPIFTPAATEELRSETDLEALAEVENFISVQPLTSSSNLVVTVRDAKVRGLGRVANLELRVSGRFQIDGDLCVVTDLGFLNVSAMVRAARSLL